MDYDSPYFLCCKAISIRSRGLSDKVLQVALFLLCMPVIAAPLQALAVLGAFTVFSLSPQKLKKNVPGFVLVGIPIYYLTRRPDSAGASRLSRIFCAYSATLLPLYLAF